MTVLRFLIGFIAGVFTLKSTRILRMASDISQLSLFDAVTVAVVEDDTTHNQENTAQQQSSMPFIGEISSPYQRPDERSNISSSSSSISSTSHDEAKNNSTVGISDVLSHDENTGQQLPQNEISPDLSPKQHVISDSSNSSIHDFQKQKGVVIAYRIHGPEDLVALKQSLCLLHAAYNRRMRYDIFIFSTLSIDKHVHFLRQIVHPVAVLVYEDLPKMSLENQVSEMTKEVKANLVQRCDNVTNVAKDLKWNTLCASPYGGKRTVSELWRSEFLTSWIWAFGYMSKYKYMVWMDTETLPMQVWKQDPVAYMVRNDLVLLMNHQVEGAAKITSNIHDKILRAYNNKTVCSNTIGEDGRLIVKYGTTCRGDINLINDFFHITNLKYYTQQTPFFANVIGQRTRFAGNSQLAVTIPALMMAPHRTVEMGTVGIDLNLMHNGIIDGKRRWKKEANETFVDFWKSKAAQTFPEAYGVCNSFFQL